MTPPDGEDFRGTELEWNDDPKACLENWDLKGVFSGFFWGFYIWFYDNGMRGFNGGEIWFYGITVGGLGFSGIK